MSVEACAEPFFIAMRHCCILGDLACCHLHVPAQAWTRCCDSIICATQVGISLTWTVAAGVSNGSLSRAL